MQKWEYYTEFVWADDGKKDWKDYEQYHRPGWKPLQYSAETLVPQLNMRGEEGWELVHTQPVAEVSEYGGVSFGTHHNESIVYFCAWKRPKQEADAE